MIEKKIRMLIVEDETELFSTLKKLYRDAFAAHGFTSITIEEAKTAGEADELARQAKSNPYDLVSLDVNLGDSDYTGLDVLATLKRFRSAWMVSLLTGVETDKSADHTMGQEKAENLRKQLRRDAYSSFPAERLIVVEKPSITLPSEEYDLLLENRISQIALIYEEIARLRYIFRPIEVVRMERVKSKKGQPKPKRKFIETESRHWQIRFDCGDIRTLPDRAGLKTLHHLLSMDRNDSLTPEEAFVIERSIEKKSKTSLDKTNDPVADYFEAQGIQWSAMSDEDQEKLIRAALSLHFRTYVDLRGLQDKEDITPEEEDRLDRLIEELGPLTESAELAYRRMNSDESKGSEVMSEEEMFQNDLHASQGDFSQKGEQRGYDSPSAAGFRKRMERIRDFLAENGFSEFSEHLRIYLMSTGANWSYNPPQSIEWTTH